MPVDGMDEHTNLFRVTVLFNFLLGLLQVWPGHGKQQVSP